MNEYLNPEERKRKRAEFKRRCEIRYGETVRQRRLAAEHKVRRPMTRLVVDANSQLLCAPVFWLDQLKPTEEEAAWECSKCGPVKPMHFVQGWRPGKCSCQQQEMERQRREKDRQEQEAKELEARIKASTPQNCYYWLGRGFSPEQGLEDLDFKNFKAYSRDLQQLIYNVKAFAVQPEGVLLLSGPCGTGKTHLACALFNYLREKLHIPGHFVTAPKLFNYIGRKRELNEPFLDVTTKLINAPVVVFDDVDKVAFTDWRGTFYFDVIDSRCNHERRYPGSRVTIMTTNTELKDAYGLSSWIGQAAASRLNMGLQLLTVRADDYRQTMKKGVTR